MVRRRRKTKQKPNNKKKFAQQEIEKVQITNKFKKQQSQKTVEESSYKGPYIQFKKDGFFTVVNSSKNEDEDSEKQGISKSKKPIYDKTKIRSFHVSTLSHKYDADKADKTWVCVYCKYGPHKQNLGDLFGPYVVTTNNEEYKFHLMSPTRSKENVDFNGMKKISDTDYEVWIHEDCAVWSPGVFIISAHLVGLEDSVWSSVRHKCSYCQEFGAMICCLDRGCKNTMAHYPCARDSKWNLNENEFKTFCEKHENKSISS